MPIRRPHLTFAWLPALVVAVALCAACMLPAQQLARRGWSGFHTQAEVWWRHAVFYRVDPAAFQDSDGDGHGDLRGLALRVSYLRSLGVDALLLRVPAGDEDGFDDLLRATTENRLRLVVAVPSAGANAEQTARRWLTRGAAGILLEGGTSPHTAALLQVLQRAASAMPGDRIVLSDAPANAPGVVAAEREAADASSAEPTYHGRHHRHHHARRATAAGSEKPQEGDRSPATLMPEPLNFQPSQFATTLAASLSAAEIAARSPAAPLLSTDAEGRTAGRTAATPSAAAGENRALAAALLLSRGAAMVSFGQELGLETASDSGEPVQMQWTPVNQSATPLEATPAEPAPQEESGAAPAPPSPARPSQEVYGAYVPYVPPRAAVKKEPRAPGAPPTPEEMEALPGFTMGTLPAGAVINGAQANVALEDAAPGSLLRLYRRLLELHHQPGALLAGSQRVLAFTEPGMVGWLRQAPGSTAGSSTALIVVNTGTVAARLNLVMELRRAGVRGLRLRPLLDAPVLHGNGADDLRANSLELAPGELLVAEVY